MATLPITRLNTHPDGTAGAAAVVNTNWSRIEEVFNPALSNADDSFPAFWRGVVRSATDPTTSGAVFEWNQSSTRPIWRAGFASISYASSLAFDLLGAKLQKVALTGDLTFSALANQAAGLQLTVIVEGDGSLRTLSFPAWTWVGSAAPANLAANKTARLTLQATGTNAGDVIASWDVEP